MKKIFLFLMIFIISANLVSAALIAHYSFDNDDMANAIITDDSGNDNTGIFYNKNTKLLMSFDNQDATDESGSGNDGKHYGNTRLLMNFENVQSTTAEDESDYDNHGTLVGDIDCTLDTDPATLLSGKYCRFDGANDKIALSEPTIKGTMSWTWSAWINHQGGGGYARVFSAHNEGSDADFNNPGIAISKYSGTNNLELVIKGATGSSGTGNSGSQYWIPNEWHFYTIVYDSPSGNTIVYRDAATPPYATYSGTPNMNFVHEVEQLGTGYENGDGYRFAGLMDEVAVYSEALILEEIQALHDAQKAKFIDWSTDTKSGDGSALEFDGVDDYVRITRNSGLDAGSEITISAWIYPLGSGAENVIVSKGFTEYEFDWATNDIRFYWGGGAAKASVSPVPINVWSYVVVTHSDYTNRTIFYVDGVLTANVSETDPAYPLSSDVFIGRRSVSAPQIFNGSIDEVAIYSKVLSPDEINQHYLDKKAKFTDWTTDTPPGLGGYALEFDGIDDYVDIFHVDDPTEYTISAWVQPKGTTGDIITRTNGGSGWSHQLRINNLQFEHYTWDGSANTITDPDSMTQGRWYHITAVAKNNDVAQLYVNGEEKGTPEDIGTLWTGGNNYYMGYGFAQGYFRGKIDEVKIYNEALSPEQVQNEFSRGNAYWRPPPEPERFGAPGFIPNLITVLIIMSALTLLSLHNIRKK